jgi:hypothetical protein
MVFVPARVSVTWPPCGTLQDVTQTIEAVDGLIVNENGKLVV